MTKYWIRVLLLILLFSANTCLAAKNRIISLAPSHTELLYAMGFGDQIVGVSKFSNYPSEALKLPIVGDIKLDIEKIIMLKPTLIIDINSMRKSYENLFKQLGLNYIDFSFTEPTDIKIIAEKLGKLLHEEDKSKRFIKDWGEKYSVLMEEIHSQKTKPYSFYLEIWPSPPQSAASSSFVSKIIEKTGCVNILQTHDNYPIASIETILKKNPDIIFLCYPSDYGSVENIKNRPAWNKMEAVKKGRIFPLNQDLFIRPGPRNIDGIKEINKILRELNL